MSVANVYKARSRVQQLLHEAVERFLADSHKTIE
jgi:hypothetical protein